MKSSDSDKSSPDVNNSNPEQSEERRQALKDMLASNEARHLKAAQKRRPSLVPGRRLAIIAGALTGKHGVVLDADFITNRVQMKLDDLPDSQWVPFQFISNIST